MSTRAWLFIGSIIAVAALISLLSALHCTPTMAQWTTLAVLVVLATLAQLFKAEAPNHVLFYATFVFLFAGVLLLPTPLFAVLVLIPHLVEWAAERLTNGPHLRQWYLQPFNIAMYTLSGIVAQTVSGILASQGSFFSSPTAVVALTAGAVTYVAVNHLILGWVLVLARGVSWRDSGMLDGESLLTDFVLVCLGAVVAALWNANAWLIPLALTPLVMMYRALLIPKLRQEAQTDGKTGLANARHFAEMFAAELERARRFERPLAVIMADLDRFKAINDTFGHLAGDSVLAAVARVIRETIREYDIAGRFGGEEFAIVLPEVEPEQARAFAERLRLAIAETQVSVPSHPQPLRVTISLGVATFPADGETTTALTQAADTAVYQAKATGRDRVVLADDVQGILPAIATPLPYILTGDTQDGLSVAARPIPADAEAASGSLAAETVSTPSGPPLWLFVGGVIAAGVGVTLLGLTKQAVPPPILLGLLAGLAGTAELLQLELYVGGTISVSVSVIFAAAILTGVPGLACVSATVALVHHLRQGRRIDQLYRTAFNWAVHILAGCMPVLALAMDPGGTRINLHTLPALAVPAVAAALAYYIVETGLVSTAISLQEAKHLIATWREQYQWLAGHYLALCFIGLVFSVAYATLGILGIMIFALPAFMMHLAQRQYIDQTRRNVRELQRINQELTRAALTDHVTGLGNQRALQEEVLRAATEAAQTHRPVALAWLDVDELKVINSEQGRDQGDRVLIDLAVILRQCCPGERAFRVDGDEFALLLSGISLTDATILMERLRQDIQGRLKQITVSVGVATSSLQEHDTDLLQDQAKAALREAKRRGRNVVIAFDSIATDVSVTSAAQAHAVRRLIAAGHITIAFQPIWDLEEDRLLAVEALARPDLAYGLQGPQEAFDIAEQMGRAHDLDAVCRDAILRRAVELPPGVLLFLNVSPQTLDHDALAGTTLVDAVRKAGLSPEQVVLELTERSMARLSVVVREARRLRDLGFKLALDDTGAGNAGLEMLSQLPVDYVKIDRAVVANALSDNSARAVVAGILAIARETGTYVIAEGIETGAMLRLVREIGSISPVRHGGVQGVQGYLLGRPEHVIPQALPLPWTLTA